MVQRIFLNNNKNSYRAFIVAVILLISAMILRIDIPKIDDVPYHVVETMSNIDESQFLDYDLNDNKISFRGLAPAITSVSLKTAQSLMINFEALNPSTNDVSIHIDLYNGEDFDKSTEETTCLIKPGNKEYNVELPYFREAHPDFCYVRFFSYDESSEIILDNIRISWLNEVVDNNRIINILTVALDLVIIFSLLLIFYYLTVRIRQLSSNIIKAKIAAMTREGVFYLLITGLVVVLLWGLYRNVDIHYPLTYLGGDECGVYYLVKTIKEYGTALVNHRAGGLFGAEMYDYPYADKLSFILVKTISCFVDNTYLITNIFYFLCYFLISYSAFFVCRRRKLEPAESVMVSILFSFSAFIQIRYGHLWLVPYFMLPIAYLIAMYILHDEMVIQDGSHEGREYDNFILFAFLCGFTGLYYAYFSCALFSVALVIRLFSSGKDRFKVFLKNTVYIFSCIFGVLVNVLPNILYYIIHGMNAGSELAARNGSDTELYGLKLVQMILPRPGHRIHLLAEIAAKYNNGYPNVNENVSACLGIVASIGLVIIILNLITSKKIWNESKFVISLFLIGTVGGLGTIISVFVSIPIRCYNRLSLLIMFLSLSVIAKLLSCLRGKIPKPAFIALISMITIAGYLDQTLPVKAPKYQLFDVGREFVHSIEAEMNPGDMIYQLPYTNWPSGIGYRTHIGYIESKDLIWSYGAMQGREEADWQAAVAQMKMEDMVKSLLENMYDGIYYDKDLCKKVYGEGQADHYLKELTRVLGTALIVSDDQSLYYWKINT